MVIKPDEANKLTDNEMKLVGKLERAIDETIRKNYLKDSKEIVYAFPEEVQDNERIQTIIQREYSQSGWNARLGMLETEQLEYGDVTKFYTVLKLSRKQKSKS